MRIIDKEGSLAYNKRKFIPSLFSLYYRPNMPRYGHSGVVVVLRMKCGTNLYATDSRELISPQRRWNKPYQILLLMQLPPPCVSKHVLPAHTAWRIAPAQR